MLLYEAPHVVRRQHRASPLLAGARRSAPGLAVDRPRRFSLLESELDRAIGTLHHKAQAFEVQIGEFGPARLDKAEAFRFFRELVNYDPGGRRCARGSRTTRTSTTSSRIPPIDCHRDHLLVGDRLVKVLSMKEPPSQTFAFLLQDLYDDPGRVHRLPRMAAHPERPDAARRADAAAGTSSTSACRS